MLYDFLNQKEYIDISKINVCSVKSINNIISEYALLISRSCEHYVSPCYNKMLSIKLVFENSRECDIVYKQIENLKKQIQNNKHVLIQKILLKLKALDIQYNFEFLPNIYQHKQVTNNNNSVEITYKQDCSFIIQTIYDFFVFIKLNNGPYSDDINKLVNYVLSYSLNKFKNLFEFDFIIKSITDKSVYQLWFNIYYEYNKKSQTCQYLLITDIFANNPIKINHTLKEFEKYAYFDDILKIENV